MVYDPNQFRPKPVFNEETGKWEDQNIATRKQNNRAAIEQEIDRRKAAGYSLPDIAIHPHPIPKGAAGPEKYPSAQDYERAQTTFQAVQGSIRASGGVPSTEAALGVTPINQALREGRLPIRVAGQAANIMERMQQEGRRTADTHAQQLLSLGQKGEGEQAWEFLPQKNLPNREALLKAYHQAQPSVQALQQKTMENATRLTGKPVPLETVQKFIPALSHQQLVFVQSPAPMKAQVAGPGGGKSAGLVAAIVDQLINQGMSAQSALEMAVGYIFLSQTKSAGTTMANKLTGIEQLVPGWNATQRDKQIQTFAHFGMSLLNQGQRTGTSLMQQMGLSAYKPLYEGEGKTIEEEQAKRAHEQVLRRVFEHHGLDKSVNNINQLSQNIAEIKGTTQAEFEQRVAQGKKHYASMQWKQDKVVSPDMALYLYQQALHAKPGFTPKGQTGPVYDVNDVPRLLVAASESKKVKNFPQFKNIVVDESQDTPEMMALALTRMRAPSGRILAAGDPSQQAIARPWDFNKAFKQQGAELHPQEINFRTGKYGVETINPLLATSALAGRPRAPFQVAFKEQDSPTQYRVEKDFPTTYQSMFKDWMKDMGLTPKMMAESMREGQSPFDQATTLPMEAPFIFQRGQEGRDAFLGQVRGMLGKHMSPDMINQFFEQHVSTESPSVENVMKLHATTMAGVRGETVHRSYIDATRQGLWDKPAYAGQLYTMMSRASEQSNVYSSMTPGKGQVHDLTPGYIGGQQVPYGFDQLIAAGAVGLVSQQGMRPEDLSPFMQGAYAQGSESGQSLADPDAIKQFAQMALFMEKSYSSPVGSGAGILEGDQGAFVGAGFSVGDLTARGTLNQNVVAGQTKASAISASKMAHADRLSHEMIMHGVSQIARGKATLGPAGEILAEPLHLQSQREPVPSHEEFMAQVHQVAGPIDAKILMDPIEREAGSVFEDIDNLKMKEWAGDNQFTETGDITKVRKFAQAALSSPAFRDTPQITSQLEKHLTHPKVLEAAHQKIQELAQANPRLAKGLRQRKDSLKPLEWDSETNDWSSQSDLKKFQDLAEKHVLSKDQQLGLEGLQKQQSLDLNARGEGGLQDLMRQFIHRAEGNRLYHPEMKDAIYGAASKVLPWKKLDPELIGFMGRRAADFSKSPLHEEKEGFWNNASKVFQAHATGVHEDGSQLSWEDLGRIGKRDPMQARLLENIFGDKQTGEMLPYTHPDVKRAVNEIVYRQGSVKRNINAQEAPRLGVPLAASRNAPAETELAAFHSALEGGNWEGHGAGAVDLAAVRADPIIPGTETAKDDDYSFTPLGSGSPLHAQEARYRDLVNNPHMTAKKREGFQEQLDLVKHVRSQFGSKDNQRDWAHMLRVVMRATTGEDTIDLRTGKEYQIDPVRKLFRNRDATMPDARSLPRLAQFAGSLQAASQHLQKTGTLKRSHIDDLLTNFGFDPKDKRFTALRKLEQEEGFRRDAGSDPELHLQKLISHFPSDSQYERGNLQAQLTRVPLLPNTRYTYMGGQPGFASVKGSQKGIPSGIEGTLHPIKDRKGKELPFGISNVNQMHMAQHMFSLEDLAVINPTRAQYLPDDVANQQNMPLFQFRGTHQGKEYNFPVNPEQLALTDPAKAQMATKEKEGLQQSRWEQLHQQEFEKNKEHIAALARTADKKRQLKQGWKEPVRPYPVGDDASWQALIALKEHEKLPLEGVSVPAKTPVVARVDPHARVKAQLQSAPPPEETVHFQGKWMTKQEAARIRDQQIAARQVTPQRPIGESYRGYELGPDITRAVVDKIIASKESVPVSPPDRDPVDSRQMMLPGFGAGMPPVPPTRPTAPAPEEGEGKGIPSSFAARHHLETRVSQLQSTPSPLAIEGKGFFASLAPPPKDPIRVSPILTHVAKQKSLETSWDSDPYGFAPAPPPEDYYRGPSEEEIPALQSFLSDIDRQKSGPIKIQGKPPVAIPRKVSATPVESSGIPFDISDLPGLMRSPHRMQVRDGMIHPYDPSKSGIAVGGLAHEQREALEAPDQHLLLQGGPGTGKTDVGVMRVADLIAKGQVPASKTIAFSGMHSGVEEINTRFNKFLRPLLPARERDQLPMARTIHSVANQIMFPNNKPSPVLADMGLDWVKGIMANPSEEELAQQTPETATDMRDEQYRFLRDAMQKALPQASHLFQTKAQLDPILKNISKYKSDRSGPNSLYEQKMIQGKSDISTGKFTHAAALSAYEQAKPVYGKIDFHDQIHIARQMLEHTGEKALPEELKGTQMVMYDEAQDSNRENTALIGQLVQTLGPETKSVIGLDPLQALFQGAGSVPGDKIIPSFREALGGEAGHVQLRENFRSSKKDTALANSILQMKAMKGKKELSPLQNPHSAEWGHDPKFLLAKSQPNLYKQMFSSMLGRTGAPTDTIKENILKGNHPFEGVDWGASGMTRPGEIPAIFMTHAQTDLFGATAPRALEELAPGKITPQMAREAFAKMHRTGLPGKFASKEEREGYDEKQYFRSLMVGQSRGLAFQYPHADVTVAGAWRRPGPSAEESYLHNLGVQVSRVKSGGQNIIGATSHVLSSDQTQGYIATGGRHFREEQPTSLSTGRVWFGPGPDDHLKVHPKNEFESYEGQAVPPHFKEIMGLQAKAVADWKAMLAFPAPVVSATPVERNKVHDNTGKPSAQSGDAIAQAIQKHRDTINRQTGVEPALPPPPLQNAKISISGNTTIQTPPNGKVTVAGADVQVDIVKSNTPLSPNVGVVTPTARQSNIGATIDALGIGGSSFISPLGRHFARGGPLSVGGPVEFNGATPRVVGSTPQDDIQVNVTGFGRSLARGEGSAQQPPQKPPFDATGTGRTFARIGQEMGFIGGMLNTISDKAVQQGSEYRRASLMFGSSGPTGDQGFFNFPQGGAGITQMQTNNLPMFSKTQIAQNLLNVASQTGGTSIPSGTSTSVMQLAALTGMDPTQLTSQMAGISGSMGQGMSAIPALEGNIGSLYKGQVTASNLTPTLQAMQSALPAMQGVSFGQGNQMQDLFGLMGAGMAGGMTAANMPDISSLIGNLSQAGVSPNLNQQAALNQLFPGQLTAAPELAQFQQSQVSMSQQAAQIGLQQQYNVPQLQMQIGNANVAMQQAQVDMGQIQQAQGYAQLGLTQQQLGASQADLNYQQEQHTYQQSSLDYQKQQLKYSEAQLGYSQQQFQYSQAQYGQAQLQQQYAVASFQQQQYVATQEYGPIGGNTGRQSYFDFMRNQQAAGYNPLSAETGTQFQASAPQGIQNMQFYAGIEHQRQDMILSRSPLLSDAKFQEDMKYLNEQEAFYKEQLDLTNEQRKFEVDWGTKMLAGQQKLIDMQGPLLATQGKLLAMQQPLLNAQSGLLRQQQGLLNSSENLLNLQQGILDTQKGMLIYTKEELDAQSNILGIQQTQVGLAQQMNAYNQAQLKLEQEYLPKELAALQAVQAAMQQQISGQGPVSGANVTPQQIIQKLSLITDPVQQQRSIRNLGLSPTDTNTLMNILKGIQTEGGYAKAMAGTNPADKSIQTNINKLINGGAFTDKTAQAAAADAALNLGGTGSQWQSFVNAYTTANDLLKSINTGVSGINNYLKGFGTFFSILGPVLTGIGMFLQVFGLSGAGSLISKGLTGGASALSTAAEGVGGFFSSTLPAAAAGAGSWITGTAIPAVGDALTTAAPWLGPLSGAAAGAFGGYEFAKNFPLTSLMNDVFPGSAQKASQSPSLLHLTQSAAGGAWNGIKSGASSAWNWLTTPFGGNKAEAAPAPSNPKGHDFGSQPNVIPAPPSTSVWSADYKNIIGIFAPLGKTFQGYWNAVASGSDWLRTTIRGKISDAWHFTITTFSPLGKTFQGYWTTVANGSDWLRTTIRGKIGDAWHYIITTFSPLGKTFQVWWNDVSNGSEWLRKSIRGKISDTWNYIGTVFSPLGKTFQVWWNDVVNGADWMKNVVGNKFNELKTNVGNIFHDMVNGIVDHLNDGIKAFATFINFFGQNLDDLEKLLTGTKGPIPVVQFTPIPHYAQGTDEHPGGLAVVGEKGRELVSLPKGAQVAPNDITELFLRMTGGKIPGYASGIGDLAAQITGWVSGGAQSILDNVVKSLHITAPHLPGMGSLSSGIFDDLKKWAVNWITSVMPGSGGGSGGGSATPVNVPGNVASWIQAAMALTHVPANWLGPLETIAMAESGGNPNAINLWDSNALAGHPSQGLFQTIPGTFAAHALPNHNNILNPIDNSAAAIGYIEGRYGDVFHVPGIVSMSQGGPYVGYGRGGIATVPQIANVAEREPEAIIPLSKLSTMLNNLSSTSVTPQTQSQPSSGKTIHVNNLIGAATFAITNTGGSQLDEKAQDDLMHQVLSLIEAALQDKNGKMN
jgi:SLT domain-containing protein/superfamily I DNA/RNA helicase